MKVHQGPSNVLLFERKWLLTHYPIKLNPKNVTLPTKSLPKTLGLFTIPKTLFIMISLKSNMK